MSTALSVDALIEHLSAAETARASRSPMIVCISRRELDHLADADARRDAARARRLFRNPRVDPVRNLPCERCDFKAAIPQALARHTRQQHG